MNKKILLSLSLTVLLMVFAATGSWAAICSDPIVNGTGSYTATIAVASNFFEPAKDMVRDYFQASAYGANTSITVCHDATGTLKNAIKANRNLYDFFFAADNFAPAEIQAYFPLPYTVVSYAKGIPVYFGYRSDVADVSGLIQNGGSGQYEMTVTGNANGYLLASAAIASGNLVAVANPAVAPYGVSAETILTDMGYSVDFSDPNNPAPAWVRAPLFPNIAQTYSGVGTTQGINYIKTGFISKAQIFPYRSLVAYVEFTNQDYTLDQTTVQINDKSAVNSLSSYLNSVIGTSAWNTFLADHGYTY